MKKINFRRVFILVGLASLLLVYSILWLRMITNQKERVGADFIGHYAAGRIAQQDGYLEIYDIVKQQTVQTEVVGFAFPETQTGYFTHPPFVVPLVNLIINKDFTGSLIRWTAILLVLNGLSTFMLVRTLPGENFRKSELWLIGLGVFLFFPTFSGLMNGQDIMLLLLGAALWLSGILRGKDIQAGLGLSLVTIRPQLAILLCAPFLFKRRKVIVGFAIGSIILVAISMALIRLNGFNDYMTILRVVESDLWNHPHAKDMPGISGLLRRNLPGLDQGLFRSLIYGGYILGIAAVSFWWSRTKEVDEQRIGLLSLLALIFVPYAHYHELALLLIPIFCLLRVFSQRKFVSSKNLVLIPVGLSILIMLGFLGTGWFRYPVIYLAMFLLGYFLLFPEKICGFSFLHQGRDGNI